MRSSIRRAGVAFATAWLAGVAFVGAAALAADFQDNAPKTTPAEEKKAAGTVDVHCKVSTEKGEPLPPGDVVISLEEACWPETTPDPRQAIGKNGEVSFSKLPACFATFIMKVEGYRLLEMEVNGKKQATRTVDLKQYKTPILITMKKL
jgi:hypothetical protein